MPFDFRTSYESAKAELARVQQEKASLSSQLEQCDQQIVALVQTMRAIAPLVGEEPPAAGEAEAPHGGMTDCVRAILKKAAEPLTASEIRESLEAVGFDMKSYSNPLATIHTVLRRLGESGEVETTHEMLSAKKFTIPVSKHLAVEKIVGKGFRIGEKRGFIGVGRLVRRSRTSESTKETR
jgi:hypothetical protein